VLLVAAACGAAPVAQPRSPTLRDATWFAGTWHAAELDSHWQLVGDTFWGIALSAQGGFEVNVIADTDEIGAPAQLVLVSLAGGRDPQRFALRRATPTLVELGDAHEGVVRVTKTARGWRGEFAAPAHPVVGFDMEPGTLAEPPELIATDRAFAADTAKDGADGWVRHFADDGAMWLAGRRVEGKEEIRAVMAEILAGGTLAWEPLASGARGDRGFTLGTLTVTPAGERPWRSSYAMIWKRQADGSWAVLFEMDWSAHSRLK
jgi:ketosteroid isomerase-like protein